MLFAHVGRYTEFNYPVSFIFVQQDIRIKIDRNRQIARSLEERIQGFLGPFGNLDPQEGSVQSYESQSTTDMRGIDPFCVGRVAIVDIQKDLSKELGR